VTTAVPRRVLRLYAASRSLPLTLLGLAALAPVTWALGEWMWRLFDGPGARLPVTVAAPLLAATVIGGGLGGADDEFEGVTAVPWWRWRVLHVAALTAWSATLLALAGLREPWEAGAVELVRNTAGCVGLVALGAVVLGPRLSWVPAFAYIGFAYAGALQRAVSSDGQWREATAWVVQPGTAGTATGTALALLAVGTAVYARCGPKR
jgi:hypothetical protein